MRDLNFRCRGRERARREVNQSREREKRERERERGRNRQKEREGEKGERDRKRDTSHNSHASQALDLITIVPSCEVGSVLAGLNSSHKTYYECLALKIPLSPR